MFSRILARRISSGVCFRVATSRPLYWGVLAILALCTGCLSIVGMSITTSQLSSARIDAAYSSSLTAVGGVLPYHWSVESGTLPAGITLNGSTGALSGVAQQAGEFKFTARVSDSSGGNKEGASRQFLLSVSASGLQITTAFLPPVETGIPFHSVLAASGGVPPYHWAIVSGPSPPGVSLDTNTGVLSGAASESGQLDIAVQVSDSSLPTAETAVKSLILPVVLALQIAPAALPSGQVGQTFQALEFASGGAPPYRWALIGGLPSGLSLSASSGAVTGVPTEAATSSFTVVLSDSAGNTVQKPSVVTIHPAPQALSITTTTLAQATEGDTYDAGIEAAGGTPPYTWSVGSGQLPEGLQLAPAGNIQGTPAVVGQDTFTVRVTDSSSPAMIAYKALSVTVAASLPAPTLDSYGGDAGHSCAGTLKNGNPASGATGYFYLYKDSTAKHWYLCDPTGNRFWMLSVQVVSGMTSAFYSLVTAKYASAPGGWTAQEATRLKSIGFNTIGEFANLYEWPVPTYGHAGNTARMPFLYMINPSTEYYRFGIKDVVYNLPPAYAEYRGETFPDIFDPQWTKADLPSYFSANGLGNPFQNSGGYKAADASPYVIGTTLDDSDALWGFKGFEGSYPHVAWMVWMMTPYMGGFADTTVHIKQEFANYLQAKYGTISTLNNSWGSSYSSFGSSASTITGENIGTGNGSQTSFTHKLEHAPVDPDSVAVFVGKTLTAADCPWFNQWSYNHTCPSAGAGAGIVGNAGSTLTYGNGQMTIVFPQAPAPGAAITVNYQYGGWPKATSGGTGLLDEDGTSPWFIPDPPDPAPGDIGADLDGFLSQIAKQYFSTVVGQVRANLPHHLVFSPDPLGPMTRAPVLAQAAQYLDGVMMEMEPLDGASTKPFDHRPGAIAAYNKYGFPSFVFEIKSADPDSPYPKASCTRADDCFSTQATRGASYKNDLTSYFSTYTGADGYGFVVGVDYWQFTDNSSESANFGLVTINDNFYDGVQSCGRVVTDSFGFVTKAEQISGCYGDFIDSVKAGNSVWLGK
jgi:hypothetical protein